MSLTTLTHRGLAGLALMLATAVWADGAPKLGFINTERVYQESKPAQAIHSVLEREFAPRQARVQQMQAQGLALKARLEQGHVPEAERAQQVQRLLEMDAEYRREAARLAEDFNLRRNEEFASLQQKANRVIADLAHREGYNWIDDDVVYVSQEFDITDKVIRILNTQ